MERDPYAPIKGKCVWWREFPVEEDKWNTRLKPDDRAIACSCFVEGKGWMVKSIELPDDCPDKRACRYYIKNT